MGTKADPDLFPQAYVVPIFSVSPPASQSPDAERHFCGTGFFVGEARRWLITCAHCVNAARDDVAFYYMTLESKNNRPPSRYLTCRDIGRPSLHPTVDVAAFEVADTGYLCDMSITLDPIHWQQDLGCVEFSMTVPLPGELAIERRTRFHKGHITGRYVRSGIPYYSTSFRAFEGASGAPVIWERDGSLHVVGMLNAEVEESTGMGERLLARREVERDGHKVIEQNWYSLPAGEAMEARALLAALEDLGVTPTVVCRS